MSDEEYQSLKVLSFPTRDEWWSWLEQHHGQTEAVWLKMAKKSTQLLQELLGEPE